MNLNFRCFTIKMVDINASIRAIVKEEMRPVAEKFWNDFLRLTEERMNDGCRGDRSGK